MDNLEEETQYDIYFQGGKEDLFAFLYPLTGSQSPIFDHLDLQSIRFDPSNKQFNFLYNTKQFKNSDRQNSVNYESIPIATNSNYFYSTKIPGEQALVWRNVKRMTELRPHPYTEQKMQDESEVNHEVGLVAQSDPDNKIMTQIHHATQKQTNRNWEVGKSEYISRLCQ